MSRPCGVSYEQHLEIVELRRRGLSIPAICTVLEHFYGDQLTYGQVRHAVCKAGVTRGTPPDRAKSPVERYGNRRSFH